MYVLHFLFKKEIAIHNWRIFYYDSNLYRSNAKLWFLVENKWESFTSWHQCVTNWVNKICFIFNKRTIHSFSTLTKTIQFCIDMLCDGHGWGNIQKPFQNPIKEKINQINSHSICWPNKVKQTNKTVINNNDNTTKNSSSRSSQNNRNYGSLSLV